MDTNRRRHPRVPMTVDIKIQHPTFGERVVKTKNISDSGLFILVDPPSMPDVGNTVSGQVQGLMTDAPTLAMEIVRTEEDGLGLRYIDTD